MYMFIHEMLKKIHVHEHLACSCIDVYIPLCCIYSSRNANCEWKILHTCTFALPTIKVHFFNSGSMVTVSKVVSTYVIMLFIALCLTLTDLADLNLPKTCQMDFPDPDDLLNFSLVIMPDEVHKYNQCMMLS